MVHTWVSLTNDKMERLCQNKRILRIFRNEDTRFYGDYNLDIYLSAKNDYANIEAVVSRVIASHGGWIRGTKMSDTTPCVMGRLDQYMSDCGNIPDREFKKMFPRREDGKVIKGLQVRKDVSQHSEEDDEEEEEEEEDAQPTRRRKRLSIQELRRLSGTKKGKK